jgi:hypothetical protein
MQIRSAEVLDHIVFDAKADSTAFNIEASIPILHGTDSTSAINQPYRSTDSWPSEGAGTLLVSARA